MRYYTPLRYPGGKAALAPFIRKLIISNGLCDGVYIEPYAGGAAVGLELLMTGLVKRIVLNDADSAIYAFWRVLLDSPEELKQRICQAQLNVTEWRRQQQIYDHPELAASLVDYGFAAFYLNRVNRSGILTGGLIGGLKQQGRWLMDARFNRVSLCERIDRIAPYRSKIEPYNQDADRFLLDYESPARSLYYIDPPYYCKGQRLYRNHYVHDDHARVSRLIQGELNRPWLVSYDNVAEISHLYKDRRQLAIDLRYSAQIKRDASELLIFNDELQLSEPIAEAI